MEENKTKTTNLETQINDIDTAIDKIKGDQGINSKRRKTVRTNIAYGLLCLAISGFSVVLSAAASFIPMLVVAGVATAVFVGFTTKYTLDLIKLDEEAKSLDALKDEYRRERKNLMYQVDATAERENLQTEMQTTAQEYNTKMVDCGKDYKDGGIER